MVVVVVGGTEVFARRDGGLFDEAVGHGVAKAIAVEHVLEVERRRRQFQAKQRLQFVDRLHACRGAIPVRLVHQQHEIRQAREILEVALTQYFLEPHHTGLGAATRIQS